MAIRIHCHGVNMVIGLSAGLSNDHNIYHFNTVIHPKICEKCKKSVHHLLCEGWMIFEPTDSMSEWSLPSSGMWHHVFWWVGCSILDESATSIYSVKDICIYVSNYMYQITVAQCKETRVYFKNMFFARMYCYMGKESCEKWMTCQKIAGLIHKTVRTLICFQ